MQMSRIDIEASHDEESHLQKKSRVEISELNKQCQSPIIKSQPNFVFASWLCFKFGQDRMREGRGVIDIAGGNGLLSFELTCRYGVPSTVLDPRQMKFSSILRRRMKKLTKNRLKDLIAVEHNNKKSHRLKWENCIIKVKDDNYILERVKEAIESESCSVLPFQQYQVYFEGSRSRISESRENDVALLSEASIFVGMHPDQATEYIVDAALELNKPFAVVPCCVFTNLFPKRKTPSGSIVRTYEELIEYLQHKDPRIRKEYLPYSCGRNIVLYME